MTDLEKFEEMLDAVEAASDRPPIYYLPRLDIVSVGTKDYPLTGIQDIKTLIVFGVTKDNQGIGLDDTDYTVSQNKLTILNTEYDYYAVKYYRMYHQNEEHLIFEIVDARKVTGDGN